MLTILQNRLEVLEFQDSNIDVFVDTTVNFRVIVMCNVAPIFFGNVDLPNNNTNLKLTKFGIL